MKKQTCDLSGAALDWAVGVSEGYETAITDSGCIIRRGVVTDYFDPSTNWGWGGPIIERERIRAAPSPADGGWAATSADVYTISYGPTLLIAAMRHYVDSKLGSSVDVPI